VRRPNDTPPRGEGGREPVTGSEILGVPGYYRAAAMSSGLKLTAIVWVQFASTFSGREASCQARGKSVIEICRPKLDLRNDATHTLCWRFFDDSLAALDSPGPWIWSPSDNGAGRQWYLQRRQCRRVDAPSVVSFFLEGGVCSWLPSRESSSPANLAASSFLACKRTPALSTLSALRSEYLFRTGAGCDPQPPAVSQRLARRHAPWHGSKVLLRVPPSY